MNSRLDEVLREIRELEKTVEDELLRRQEELKYRIRKGRVIFEEELAELHKKLSLPLLRYIFGARLVIVLSAPVVYSMIIPALVMDIFISLYQRICFPVYGIPLVRRREHIVFDRHYLKYLNALEKINCLFCGYFNGLASYVQEIAGRTEQYWCPIKHASRTANIHSRYHLFADYGDAEAYRSQLKEIRKKFDDLE